MANWRVALQLPYPGAIVGDSGTGQGGYGRHRLHRQVVGAECVEHDQDQILGLSHLRLRGWKITSRQELDCRAGKAQRGEPGYELPTRELPVSKQTFELGRIYPVICQDLGSTIVEIVSQCAPLNSTRPDRLPSSTAYECLSCLAARTSRSLRRRHREASPGFSSICHVNLRRA